MKTIKERAENYASQRHVLMNSTNRAACYGYIAGAHSEREELLRWRDPEKELPEDGATVLGKTTDVQHPFVIMRYLGCRWLVWAYPGWAGPSGKVIGWRPIHEIE